MEFGGVVAMNDVSIEVHKGQIFGIIGPNGAGKTTLFNCVTGVYRPTAGEIELDGRSIAGQKPHHITVGGRRPHVPEHPPVPEHDRRREHHGRCRRPARDQRPRGAAEQPPLLPGGAASGRPRPPACWSSSASRTAPSRPPATSRTATSAGSRSPGRSPPSRRSCLLDEPAAGFNPAEKQALIALIRQIRDSGLTVVLIEHDMGLVMNVCDRIAVLDFGEKIAEGLPAEIQSDPRVIAGLPGGAVRCCLS